MPRDPVDVLDGIDLPDHTGVDLPDLGAARLDALRQAGEILNDRADRNALGEDWRMEVTDAVGLIYLRLDVHVTDAPVIRSDRRRA